MISRRKIFVCSSRRNFLFLFLSLSIIFTEGVVRAYLFPSPSSDPHFYPSLTLNPESNPKHFVLRARNPKLSDLSDFGASNFDELEQEVYSSTRAQLDVQKVKQSITDRASPSTKSDPQKTAIMAAQWKISLAAASFVSTFFLIATHSSLPITGIVFVAVFFVANQDPLEEEGFAGALARLLGRFTIQSVETTKPKLKAMARAAITSENDDREQIILLLQQRVDLLERENHELKKWKEQRSAADTLVSQYGLEELKSMARQNQLPVGGTKIQLLMRLIENRVLIPM